VAVDAAGNVLIADTYNHRIRKVNSAGVITTVVGNGADSPIYFPTWTGGNFEYCPIDGTTISIPYPENIFTDTAGSLHFGDGNQIWKLGTGSMLTAVASAMVANATCGGSPVELAYVPGGAAMMHIRQCRKCLFR
jgi:hypothetical protein